MREGWEGRGGGCVEERVCWGRGCVGKRVCGERVYRGEENGREWKDWGLRFVAVLPEVMVVSVVSSD